MPGFPDLLAKLSKLVREAHVFLSIAAPLRARVVDVGVEVGADGAAHHDAKGVRHGLRRDQVETDHTIGERLGALQLALLGLRLLSSFIFEMKSASFYEGFSLGLRHHVVQPGSDHRRIPDKVVRAAILERRSDSGEELDEFVRRLRLCGLSFSLLVGLGDARTPFSDNRLFGSPWCSYELASILG